MTTVALGAIHSFDVEDDRLFAVVACGSTDSGAYTSDEGPNAEWVRRVVVEVHEIGVAEKRTNLSSGRVFIRGRLVWLAWYPKRGLKCMFDPERTENGWHLSVAVGPLYLGLGPGTPSP